MTRSMLHRLARLEPGTARDGCPVCGYAPGAKRRSFIKLEVHVPGVTEDCPDDPDPCPGCGRHRRVILHARLDRPLDPCGD